jgi:hypothetical protein
MGAFRNFWRSGLIGKIVIISAGALGLFSICCVALVALAAAGLFVTPSSTSGTAPSPVVSVGAPVAAAATDEPTIIPEPTPPPPPTTAPEPTALPTVAPSATPAPTETPPPPTEANKLTAKERQAVVDMGTHLTSLGEGLSKIGELSQNMQNTDAWRLQMAAAIVLIRTEHAALMEMDVPPKIEPLHSAVVNATADCNLAMDKIVSGLDTSSVSDIQAGAVLMRSCGTKTQDAKPELDALLSL